ncbi:MAG: formyl-CoA transferase [Sphingopyxis sp.]|nr:MAG: formyl-CoA transferase [Sphingopyxis sp.]|tara:strand:- start:2708 stop:3928 length:1221 start_codon:yes stop_codon:yes gene_type:complete
MNGVLSGIKVIEVAIYAFVPAAGAVLSDMGADVLKIEHPENPDPMRNLSSYGINKPGTGGPSVLWQVMNRGKRSVGIDIRNPEGLEVLMSLVDEADIFLTNFMQPARAKLGIDAKDILARNPRIIYGRGTGHGPVGPDANRPGFDALSYWARSGAAIAGMSNENRYPALMPGPAFGDIQGGMNLAGGIMAGLYQRERTGKGCVVDVSLLSSGMWAMAASTAGAYSRGTDNIEQLDRTRAPNPIANIYRSSDDRYFIVGALEGDRFWPSICKIVNRPDLIEDARFATSADRTTNSEECVAILESAFETMTLAQIAEALEAAKCPWAAINPPIHPVEDEQANANNYIQMVECGDEGSLPIVSAPIQIDEQAAVLTPAPGHCEHTDEILMSSGLTMDELLELKVSGAIF